VPWDGQRASQSTDAGGINLAEDIIQRTAGGGRLKHAWQSAWRAACFVCVCVCVWPRALACMIALHAHCSISCHANDAANSLRLLLLLLLQQWR